MAQAAGGFGNDFWQKVYGQDYRWAPAIRQLSMPAGKEFDAMAIKPITVPKL